MNKITKLLLLTLALTLVIGMTVAFAASAEDETLPTIVGKNILYTDKTAIQIAVDADTVDADDVKLVAVLNGVKANYTTYTIGKEDTAVAGDYVFTIAGIPASAISDEITFTVVSGGKESKPLTYSVAEYFYERLYSDGIVNATAGKDAARKEFYETYLANGAAAQELFRNYDSNGNYVGGTTLVTDYNVLAVKDGVLANGKEIMLSTDAITSTVTANAALAADKNFNKKWTVTNHGDTTTTTITNGDSVTSNGYVSVAPIFVYTDATGEYFLSDAKGARLDYDAEGVVAPSGGNISAFTNSAGNVTAELGIKDGALVCRKILNGSGSGAKFRWTYDGSYSSYTTPVHIVEFDMMLSGVTYTAKDFATIEIHNAKKKIVINMRKSGDEIKLYTSSVDDGITISQNEMYNLRFECDYANNQLVYYINNEVEKVSNVTYATSSSTCVWIANYYEAYGGQTFTFDNVYLGFAEDVTPAN